jgi:hypothetical protein
MTEIKLPFKSSPQAIRADPPCRTRQGRNLVLMEKKQQFPIDILVDQIIHY